jgi:hypothetical protein
VQVEDGRIAEMVAFHDPALFPIFGLPPTVPATSPATDPAPTPAPAPRPG